MPEAVRILLYGLLAAASPVTALATLVVLGSGPKPTGNTAMGGGLMTLGWPSVLSLERT
jgi:hypothetical protein